MEDIEQKEEEEEEGSKLERKSLCSLCWREGGGMSPKGEHSSVQIATKTTGGRGAE